MNMIGKKIQGEFRTPAVNVILLCSILVIGIQLLLMITASLFFGLFCFMNPEKRANILNVGILFFCSMGLPGDILLINFIDFGEELVG